MTGRADAAGLLNEGFDLLKKYGLYRDTGKARHRSLERTVKDLELDLDPNTPEVAVAWRALCEAKRLIGFRDALDGKRVLLGDYFVGLSVRLLLPLRSQKLMDTAREQVNRIGAKEGGRFSRRRGGYTTDQSALAAEDPAKNKLIQVLERGAPDIASREVLGALSRMEDLFRSRFAGPDAGEMDAAIYGALTGGGKRLRPILLFLGAGFGRPVEEARLTRMMASMELIHAASLVHDDIVDRSPLRHGRPTVNAERGDGCAARCGFQMVSAVLELLSEAEEEDEILRLFADIPMEMCLGELRQIDVEFRPETQTEEDYYRRIERKTAKLIEGACRAGGLVSQAEKETVDALSEFGHALGILFQLRDDLLDYRQWADEGKPVLQDIERGIYSLPLLYALERAGETSRVESRLYRLLRQPVKTPEEVRYLLETAERSGGIAYAARAVEREAWRAYAALSKLPPCWQRDGLACLLDALAGDVLEYTHAASKLSTNRLEAARHTPCGLHEKQLACRA